MWELQSLEAQEPQNKIQNTHTKHNWYIVTCRLYIVNIVCQKE